MGKRHKPGPAASPTTRNDSATSRTDGWANILSGLGTPEKDKRTGGAISAAPLLTHSELTELYVGDPVAQRIVELPAREQTREWIKFHSDDDSDTGNEVMQALQVLGAQDDVTDALAWSRLYGGSVIILGADDGQQDLTKPLNLEAIRSLEWLTVLDRFQLQITRWYSDPCAPHYGKPEVYRMASVMYGTEPAQALGKEIHESRIIRFDGVRTPQLRRQRNAGWCDGIFTAIHDVLRDFWSSYDGAAALLQDFSQAVFKVKGLAALVAGNQKDIVMQRMQMVDMVRSVLRAAVIDTEEEFERKATPLAGMPELLDRMQQLLSSVTGIPVTLLMGRSPAGMNSTGDADVRFFYDLIRADQETSLRPKLERLITVLLRAKSGPTNGVEPEGWAFSFKPLWQLSDKEQADLRKVQADTDQVYISNGVLHESEVRDSRFGGDGYSSDTTLDPELDAVEQIATAPLVDPNADPATMGSGMMPADETAGDEAAAPDAKGKPAEKK